MANNAVKYSQPDGYQELNSSQGNRLAIGVVSTLFFLFGFITCLNDILIPHLKEVFTLSYTESMLINLLFFGAYFVFSLPASKLITKIGYKNSFIVGLLLNSIGRSLLCLIITFLKALSFLSLSLIISLFFFFILL
jgi:FHS family L-fucose permease-like MFS transporter